MTYSPEHARLARASRAAYRRVLFERAEAGDWRAAQTLARLISAADRDFIAGRHAARKAANTPWHTKGGV